VQVLHDVDLSIRTAEVHALLGENGAGKSTFAKILAGALAPTAGYVSVAGVRVNLSGPLAAQEHGITLIHQEPISFPDLSVAENLAVGRDPRWFRPVRWRRLAVDAKVQLDLVGAHIAPSRTMRGLSIADQQLVEIARALALDCQLVIMDEPTAALTPQEVSVLFGIIRKLKQDGRSVIFISHRLEEVRAISDRVTVFRDGRQVATDDICNLTDDQIIQHMIGRPIREMRPRQHAATEQIALEVNGIGIDGEFEQVSFRVRQGEIVGLAGLVGAGRTAVLEAVFGLRALQHGEIRVGEQSVILKNPADAIAHGIALVPEDRAVAGIFAPLSVSSNISASVPKAIAPRWIIDEGIEAKLTAQSMDRLQVRASDSGQPVAELSGGNQQKVVLARWLATQPKVFLLDEPTRGIDIGAKAEIYEIILMLAEAGCAILLVSSEIPELLALCDRILVMSEGRISAEFDRQDATEDEIIKAAIPRGAVQQAGS
jgi:rhamnose transport system ATP-binding protein